MYITTIAPGSPAAKAGLLKDDEIIGVNGSRTDVSVGDLFDSFEGAELKLLIASSRKIREQVVIKDSKNYWSKFVLKSLDKPSDTQLKFRNNWLQK
ncbi:MAG: PDZ domain-containing protein [Bacteroidetes bacterium]|nr:PDZ domain-containing protein [Bacteroidota bacterium]